MSTDRYQSPLSERYASKEMQYIFSPDMKFRTWRKLWIALAETEKELGLNITEEQIAELKAHAEDINYEVAKEREKWRFITEKFKRAIGGYFKAQFKIMGVVALILFVGFLILKIHYAVLLAILIAFLDFLPFFGTGTALIPWAILKVLSADS